MSDIAHMFLEEMRELLEKIEEDLIQLEGSGDHSAVDSIFRYLHTIKGGAGMAHLVALSEYAHHLENLLSKVRDRTVAISADLVTTLLKGLDILRLYADDAEHGQGDGKSFDANMVSQSLQQVMQFSAESPPEPVAASGSAAMSGTVPATLEPTSTVTPVATDAPVPLLAVATSPPQTFFVHIRFKTDYLKNGGDPLQSLRSLHEHYESLLIVPHVHQVLPIAAMEIQDFRLWWSVRLESGGNEEHLLAILRTLPGLEGEDLELTVQTVMPPPPAPEEQAKLDEQVVQAGTGPTVSPVVPVITSQSQEVSTKDTSKKSGSPAVQTTPVSKKTAQIPQKSSAQNSIRVPINRLDQII